MACTLHVAWDERLTDYHFGPGHPMAPVRVELTMRLAHEFGLWSQPGVTVAAPAPAADADLELVHDEPYVRAVEAVSRWAEHPDARDGLEGTQLRVARMFGLGTEDNPVFPGMHEASALVAGATLAAARAVWSGAAGHGASIAGGMHHAMAHHASGFGVYNDVAIAIAWLLGQGAERVAYVDIDAHHGDGVQAAFYADPRVLTISLHEHPAAMFPFTGLPAETGGRGAEGSAVNVALPAGTGDASWLRAFHAIVPPLLRQFAAAGAGQPAWLRHAPARSAGQSGAEHRRAARRPRRDPRARPRSWPAGAGCSPAAGDMSWSTSYRGPGRICSPRPRASRSTQERRSPPGGVSTSRGGPACTAPEQMTDGAPAEFEPFESGYDPGQPVDRAIMATREAVFPLHGLMPL